MILDKINFPADLKNLNLNELNLLASEVRELIIKKVNTTGGHMAPNLGVVEMTIALHYVFNTPKDKIVFDVSHQCYTHKILTGRKDGFLNPDLYYKYTGYTAPEESEYDLFKVGHTSTSVSLATGCAKARDLNNDNYNVIALIGDGSLSGGEAYEGLNNAVTLNSNIIILVNDNDMSIAENHGGLYTNLKELRDTKGKSENNFFKALGFEYFYEDCGNDIEKLITIFEKVKNTNKPVVVHVHTQKGKGLLQAENNKEKFHWVNPNVLDEKNETNVTTIEDYNSVTKEFILKKVKEDKNAIAVCASTPGVFGFDREFREKLGKQYTDTGIAEEHAIAYCSALAKSGAKPILSLMSSFVQRTYDQISQDLCLNNSPLTLLIHWGGISSADATHLCSFDMALIGNIPNIVYLAPAYKEEYIAMLNWAYNQNEYPVAIRVPAGELISSGVKDNTDYSLLNKFQIVEKGSDIAIIGLGNFFNFAKELKQEILTKLNINSTLINPKFITGIDNELSEDLKQNHKLVITLESGILNGGFGEKISRFYGNSNMKVLNYGARKEFTDRADIKELYKKYHLTKELIIEDVEKLI